MKAIRFDEPTPLSQIKLLPKVLYVEDELANFETARARLSRGYELLWARNDREACALLKEHRKALCSILMDIQLKGAALSGIQLTQIFKGRPAEPPPEYALGCEAPELPIFYVTAGLAQHSVLELLQTGGAKVLSKPVDFVRLNLALAEAIASSISRDFSHLRS